MWTQSNRSDATRPGLLTDTLITRHKNTLNVSHEKQKSPDEMSRDVEEELLRDRLADELQGPREIEIF